MIGVNREALRKMPCSECYWWGGHGCRLGHMPAYLRPKPHDCFNPRPIPVKLEPPAFDW